MISRIKERVKGARKAVGKFIDREITERFEGTVSPISGKHSAGQWIGNVGKYTVSPRVIYGRRVKGRYRVI